MRLYHFIAPLVPNVADAEDVMQEVLVVLWENFQEFEPGTNFLAWARRVAHLRVLEFFRARGKHPRFLPDDVLQTVVEESAALGDQFEARRDALENCIERMSEGDRQLVEYRYLRGMSLAEIAEAVGRPANSVSYSFWRIRKSLLECIERRLRAAEKDPE